MPETTYLVLKVGNGCRIHDRMMHFRRHGGWGGFENEALSKNPGTSVDGLGVSSG